jgi:hypothetical protein
VRQVNRFSRHAVQRDGIERGKNVTGDATDGHGFPRTDNEVGQHHHPSGIEADRLRKNFRGIGHLACCVGHGHYPLAVHIADGQQKNAANGEAENAAERAAAQQPVVHDHQPAHAHHGSPTEGEVIGDAQFAGELGHREESSIPINPEKRQKECCRRGSGKSRRPGGLPRKEIQLPGLRPNT